VLGGSMTTADLDLERIDHARSRNMTFGTSPSARADYDVVRVGVNYKLGSI